MNTDLPLFIYLIFWLALVGWVIVSASKNL